jgi:hypothetical protein
MFFEPDHLFPSSAFFSQLKEIFEVRPLKKAFPLGQDTEGRAEKVLERIPLIGSCAKVNPFK